MLNGSVIGKHVVDISCGAVHTVCCTALGETYAWGNNKLFQCGMDMIFAKKLTQHIEHPCLIPSLVGIHIMSVSCGAGHTVAIDLVGLAYSWGIAK